MELVGGVACQVVWCVLVALVVTHHRARGLLQSGLIKSGLATCFHSQTLGGDGDEFVIFMKSRHAHKVGPQSFGPSQ